jgi:hypothetical protein
MRVEREWILLLVERLTSTWTTHIHTMNKDSISVKE